MSQPGKSWTLLRSQQLRGRDRINLPREAPQSQGQSRRAGPTTPQGHHAQQRRLHPLLKEPLVRLPAGQPHQPLNLSHFSSNEKLRLTAPFWRNVCHLSHHPPLSPPAHFKLRRRQSATGVRQTPEAGSRARSTPPESRGALPRPENHPADSLLARGSGNQDQVIMIMFSVLKVMLCRCWNKIIPRPIPNKIRLLLMPVVPLPLMAGTLHLVQALQGQMSESLSAETLGFISMLIPLLFRQAKL